MDRSIVYTGEIPRSYDFLFAQQAAMIALGRLASIVVGGGPAVSGLNCTATVPASLNVQVSPGQIYAQDEIDANGYGVMPANTATVLKQGLINVVTTLAIQPPSQSGYEQVYLVEAAYDDTDANPLVLPYYDAANPTLGFSGPNNSGQAQNTVRQGICTLQLKAGVPESAPTFDETTGTSTGGAQAPAVDPGYVGLWLITVTNGQTQITSADITPYPGAPFLSQNGLFDVAYTNSQNQFQVPQIVPPALNGNEAPTAAQVQAGGMNYGVDRGTPNAYAINTSPPILQVMDGMRVAFRASSTNTGPATMAVGSSGAFPLQTVNGALTAAQVVAGQYYEAIFNGVQNAWVITSVLYLLPTAATASSAQGTCSDTLSGSQIGANGWIQSSGGTILQWGSVSFNSYIGETSFNVTFPKAFPNACLGVAAFLTGWQAGYGDTYIPQVDSFSATGATIFMNSEYPTNAPSFGVSFLAVGH